MFAPLFIPERTASNSTPGKISDLRAVITQSTGKPEHETFLSPVLLKTSGSAITKWDETPERFESGARIYTSAEFSSALASTEIPSASIPSSFVIRIFSFFPLFNYPYSAGRLDLIAGSLEPKNSLVVRQCFFKGRLVRTVHYCICHAPKSFACNSSA